MRWTKPFVVVTMFASLCACSTVARNRAETELAAALVSDEDETKLGLQVRDELKKQNIKYMDDPSVVQYVQGVAGKLFPFAEKDRPGVKWQVQVIDDPKTVNAFATPGGFLYVYSGLIQAADNEAELAGVMGHEIGHVVARHSARALVSQYGLKAVTDMALGDKPAMAAQVAAQLAGQGAMLAYGRGEETEADEYGARYTAAAGYDPKGLVTFFQKIQAQEGNTPAFLAFLSTHPATSERISHIGEFITQNNLSGSDLGTARIAPIKQKLAARPQPAEPKAVQGQTPGTMPLKSNIKK